jgi:Na+/proline symporter
MIFNIDVAIVAIFLTITLIVGILQGRNVKNVRDYALGGRNFSTATLATSLIATWISGSAFLTDVSEVYKGGVFYMVPGMMGDIFSWIIICYIVAPRMGEFLGALSIADAMGNMYGSKVRFISAISSTFNCIGKVAAQFKVSATIIQLFFGISNLSATLISSAVIVIYSAFGGVRGVTFTDIIQFFAFATIVPIVGLIIWGSFDNPYVVLHTISENPLFDLSQLANPNHPKFWGGVTLALYFIIPSFNPAIFQRVSMARDTVQVSRSFFVATFARLAISMLFFWIGILLLAKDPNLEPNKLFAYIIDNYTYIGFKGLVAAGVLAMVMSTADSYINAAAVTFSYDIKKSFGIEWSEKNNLRFSYISSIFIGILAFILAFYMKGLLSLFLLVSSFYLPVVSTPFLLAIFGFRSSSKAVLAGIAAGLVTVLIWRIFIMDLIDVDSVIPGMIANLIFLLGYHYLFKQEGGWVGIQDDSALKLMRENRKLFFKNLRYKITNFSFLKFCRINTPKNESVYTFFGLFCMVSVFSTMYSTPVELRHQYADMLDFIYHSVLFIATMFLTYPVWPQTFKNSNFISVFWILGLFYTLVFVGCVQIIISHFGQFQLMTFLLSMVVLSMLVRWQTALFIILTGIISGVYAFKWYFGVDNISAEFGTLQFKVVYLLLMISSILVALFKPKQDHLEATEAENSDLKMEITHLDHEVDNLHNQVSHYSEKISDQEKEIERLGATAQKILNNVNHELRLPVGNVMNFSEMLYKGLEKHNPETLKELSDQVYKNTTRLSSMILNMLDLVNLEVKKVNLEKTLINLSEIVKNRVTTCRNIYLQGKPINFKLMIDPEIMIPVDPNYMRQAIDNLVINAINFSEEGTIIVKLEKQKNSVQFTITDQGIGIPKKDIFDIFTPFKMGSNTESKAEGRGVGLALCKSIIEAHDGIIAAESKGKGAIFRFVLPLV